MKYCAYDTMNRLIGSKLDCPGIYEKRHQDRLDDMHARGWDLVTTNYSLWIFRRAAWWCRLYRWLCSKTWC